MTSMFCHGPFRWLLHCVLGVGILIFGASTGFAQTRAAIPSPEKQKEITKLLEETYILAKLDNASKKQNAVKQLMEASRDASFGTDERYVILMSAIPLAKEIGDATNWLEAVNSLVTDFDVNAQKEKTRLLTEYLNTTKSGAQFKLVIDEVLALSQAASEENRFADANALLGTAEAAIRRVAGTANLKPAIVAVKVEVATREKEWKAFQAASAKLETKADDAAANFAVGRWHALQIGDWKAALPFLAKASDAKWKAAAELELTEPTDSMAQAATGDAWWDVAQKETAAAKTAVLIHAGESYEEAQPNLTSALKKQLVGKRLEEIASLKASDSSASSPPKSTGSNSKVAQALKPVKLGQWVDLLEWTEGADWSNSGKNWNDQIEGKPSKNGIKLKNGQYVHFPLSAILDGDYDMDVVFTRHEGADDADIQFPVGIHTVLMALSADSGRLSYVTRVNGTSDLERRPGTFSNKEPHRVLIRVRRDGEKASFNIDFDNVKDYFKWEGAYSALRDTDSTGWKTTSLQRPWIGSYGNNNLVFNQVRVRMLSGTITRDSITDVDRKQDLKNGYVRLVGEKPIGTNAHRGMFTISQVLESPPSVLELWPRISQEFKYCDDFYGVRAPYRLKCAVPPGAKSFSVVGYNCASGAAKFQVDVDAKQVYSSATNIAIIKVDIPPKASFVYLNAVSGRMNEYGFDHVYWCYPRFHAVNTERVTDKMLDDKGSALPCEIVAAEVGRTSPTHNQPITKAAPVNFRDAVPCHEFILAHAPSVVTYRVPEGMTRFTASGSTPSGAAKYEVWADGKRIYVSPEVGIVPIDVTLPARTEIIELKVDSLGDATFDYSYWCYPRLHRN